MHGISRSHMDQREDASAFTLNPLIRYVLGVVLPSVLSNSHFNLWPRGNV